jgi:hypothetical protein
MMAISGSRPQQSSYLLDGVSVNNYAGGGPAGVLGISLGVDAIEEFSVVTSNAPADYGKTAGGVIDAVTRAGTNQFHGSLYEFLRNGALDARNFFDSPLSRLLRETSSADPLAVQSDAKEHSFSSTTRGFAKGWE